ncbi:MAG TPA: type IV secretion system protein [Gammaproteobacteria bacterium]|nr:type IV secretion system protein [Gammaproteobacteria bacterium]
MAFGKKKGEASPQEALSERAPPAVASKASRNWFETFAKPQLDRNRLFVVTTLLAMLCLLMAIALIRLIPLKRVEPVLVKEQRNGSVVTQAITPSRKFTPTKATVEYFTARWVKNLLSLSGQLTQKQLSDAYRLTRGNATKEFKAFIQRTNPLGTVQNYPHRTRTVTVESMSHVEKNILVVRVRTHTLDVASHVNRRTEWILTITYDITPPTTRSEIFRDPIGYYVTDFQRQKSD